MPSLYDENVLGAKERIALAKKLQEQSDNQQAGQMVSGWYVPNYGNAVVGALKNIMGAWQEKEAKGDLDKAEREKYGAVLRSMNEMGMQAPNEFALKAGTPEQQPSLWDRGKAFVTGEDQPQAIPAQPMAQNVAQNVTPDQKEKALLGLMNVEPGYAQNILAIEKLKSDQAKALREQQNEKVPTGFSANENGTITPMNINTPTGTMPYTDYQNQLAAAKDKLVGQNISPVELQNMQNQAAHLGIANANLGLAQQSAVLQQQKFAQEQEDKKFKDVPQQQTDAQIKNFANIRKIDNAINQVKNNPNAFGAKNYLGQTINQRLDPEGITPRSEVSKIGQLEVKDISGQGVAVSERPLYAPFVPSTTDSPEKIIKNLQALKQEILNTEDERQKAYNPQQGYKPLRTYEPSQPQQPTQTPQTNMPSMDAIQAEILRRRGGK